MRSVLVTGGTRRIGKAIADRLRSDGWRVIVSSHRADAGADIVADLSEESAAARLYLQALQMDGELAAIVNNAALFTGDEEKIRMVNLVSAKKLTMLLAGRENIRCSVVNILDAEILQDGCVSPTGTKAAYLAAKRELLEYTRKSACLFADSLRVNAVAPGPVLAPEGVHEKAGATLLDSRPTPEDVALAVSYLLEAKSVTGAVLPVDSGQHLAMNF